MCRSDRTNCCERLEVLGVHRDGGMQNILAVPVRLLHSSPTLSLEELALVETLGIGAHAVERSGLKEGETALVVGAGPIGLATALFAQLAKAEVILAEINDLRRTFAKGMGWKTISSPGGLEYDIVFDATGNAQAMAASLNHVAPGGKLVFVGIASGPIALDDGLFHKREITLYASRNSAHQFPRIIRLLEEGTISVKEWMTDHLSLLELPDSFAELPTRPGLIKAIVHLCDNV
jgi:2-desacetyl-2-hydroxyethyl bacteriochlorophyllide A dehydrogenase